MMLLIALAVYINVTIDHMDVVMAILHGDLSETVYMRKLKANEDVGIRDAAHWQTTPSGYVEP